MSLIVVVALSLGAVMFIGASATMNAMFLSSFGRTPAETALLAAVSIAADIVKAVLPVVIARCAMRRAWLHGAFASIMLAVSVMLSLSSGVGFAALTRSQTVAQRDDRADAIAARLQDIRGIEMRLVALTASRAMGVIEADINAVSTDRRWVLSRSCTELGSSQARMFCGEVARLRAEMAATLERDRLTAERKDTRAVIERLRSDARGGAGDPQAEALAAMLGVDRSLPRLILPVSVAVVIEVGSIILILLVAGPAVASWEASGAPPKLRVAKPAVIPISPAFSGDAVGRQLAENRTSLMRDRERPDAR